MPTGTANIQTTFDNRQQLRTLDKAFADWLVVNFLPSGDESGDESGMLADTVRKIATAVSFALHLKHTCLDLSLADSGEPTYKGLQEPALNDLLIGLDSNDVQNLPASCCSIAGSDIMNTPLVRSGNGERIWLQKYHLFEQSVASRVKTLAAEKQDLLPTHVSALAKLYPSGDKDADQRAATEITLRHNFSVITGGPGTGKTWTVARIIALLRQGNSDLHIELAAPTGKAGNRMMESLRKALSEDSQLQGLLGPADLPEKASTLHSLLGISRFSPKPRHNRQKPLSLDVLIIDEASMVDLPMMSRVLDALPKGARLIVLGDKDQLSSVEAGGVLAELCQTGEQSVYATEDSPVANLITNHRSVKGINALADQIKQGNSQLAETWLNNDNVSHATVDGEGSQGWLERAVDSIRKLTDQIGQGVPASYILNQQSNYQILCALRNARVGVSGINLRLEKKFAKHYKYGEQAWYSGLPVMITRNDHERKLYNGDVGMVLPVSEQDGDWVIDLQGGELKACFLSTTVKAISYAQMPPFETCYAMTVHKSQGSEYNKVLLLLPEDATQAQTNPVLTRELLYTGITRARQHVEIQAGNGVLEAMVKKQTVRMSGLGK